MHTNFIGSALAPCETVHMAQVSWPTEQLAEIAPRVRILRAAFAQSQVEMAHRAGVSAQTWSHYEKGRSPPTERVLKKLKAIHGITRDWVMDGSFVGMPEETKQRLLETPDPGTRTNRRRASETSA